jgi:hypothetical protein
MSAAPILTRDAKILLSSEQRARPRYPIELALEYRLLGKKEGRGSGRTRNISSNGVLFEVSEPLPGAGSIELLLQWPCLLGGVCPLKLVLKGRIVRSDGKRVAIISKQHEFRTAGLTSDLKRLNSIPYSTGL